MADRLTLEEQANRDVERAIRSTAFIDDVMDHFFRPTEARKAWRESVDQILERRRKDDASHEDNDAC